MVQSKDYFVLTHKLLYVTHLIPHYLGSTLLFSRVGVEHTDVYVNVVKAKSEAKPSFHSHRGNDVSCGRVNGKGFYTCMKRTDNLADISTRRLWSSLG